MLVKQWQRGRVAGQLTTEGRKLHKVKKWEVFQWIRFARYTENRDMGGGGGDEEEEKEVYTVYCR